MKSIAVVGAGISGIMAAYYLAKKGNNVTVYDSERYPALKTSYANGGQISVSNSEVWNTTANLKKGLKWICKNDAPLYIHPSFEWDKIKWLSKFLFNTMAGCYEKNTIESIHLGIESRHLYNLIRSEEGIEYDYSPSGIMHFYKNWHYYSQAIAAGPLYERAHAGKEWTFIGPDLIKQIEPALLNTPNIVGGVWTPSDSTGDIHKFCYQMMLAMQERYSVKFNFNSEIKNVNQLDGFDVIVVSNGVGAKKLAKSAGDSLDIYPVKGYSITIELDSESEKYAPNVSLLDDESKIVTAKLGHRLRVAGTAELAGENYDIKFNRIKPLLNWVHENLPNINTHNYSSWACLRPMTPNMMPIVKQSKNKNNVFYHCGHGHLGWTYSPSTAYSLAEMIGQ